MESTIKSNVNGKVVEQSVSAYNETIYVNGTMHHYQDENTLHRDDGPAVTGNGKSTHYHRGKEVN